MIAVEDLLIILNPRRIEECLASYRELPIDKLWVRNMSELDIEEAWPEIMETAAGYDWLWLQSDDGIVRRHALEAVRGLWVQGNRWLGDEAVTGYSNMSQRDIRLNIAKGQLPPENWPDQINFYELSEVQESTKACLPTTLVSFSLTGMPREMWQRFPWDPNGGADFRLSQRLAAAGVPMWAARDAFVWHVKEFWATDQYKHDQDPRKQLLIGKEPPAIELEAA